MHDGGDALLYPSRLQDHEDNRPVNWLQRVKSYVAGERSQPRRAVLYTRDGCHLCEEARAVLEKYRLRFGMEIEEVDIDSDAALRAKYDRCVPVVEIDGKERFRGRVNEPLLERLFRCGERRA